MKNSIRLIFVLLFGSVLLDACAQEKTTDYPDFVGDIAYVPDQDDVGFKVCNASNVAQYYNFGKGLQFNGEKSKIIKHFEKHYSAAKFKGESGYIRVRFIVNCEGNAGRFRVQEMDLSLEPKTFGNGLAKELLKITGSLQGWGIATYEEQVFDYYQHLVFKIEDGKLTEILP
jgi:hypothetical protein